MSALEGQCLAVLPFERYRLLTNEQHCRILNVSVIPYDTHSPTKLLNVHTAPDCIIFTAIIASAAVPGILNPVVLM